LMFSIVKCHSKGNSNIEGGSTVLFSIDIDGTS
jgi:hypothetical protein